MILQVTLLSFFLGTRSFLTDDRHFLRHSTYCLHGNQFKLKIYNARFFLFFNVIPKGFLGREAGDGIH